MIELNDELSKKIREIRLHYNKKINDRIVDFMNVGKSDNRSLFIELSFCILTANTSAEMGIKTQKYIMDGFIEYDLDKLKDELKKIKYRFYNKRSDYIVNARFVMDDLKELLSSNDKNYVREYLVNNIKGIGYKEASHFLRNTGIFDFAILDKHIMETMMNYNYIDNVKLNSKNDYLETEEIFNRIAKSYKLKPGIFDLYLWKIATNKILK